MLDRKPAKITQFHHPCLARILGCQALQRGIDGDNLFEAHGGDGKIVISQLDPLRLACAALCLMRSSMIHKHLPHHMRREADVVGAIVPFDLFSGEAQVGFIDQGGSLESMTGALSSHIALSEPVEFAVKQGKHPFSCVAISLAHLL